MSSRISPTAHYTGHVWVRHGLADARLGTKLGRVLFEVTRPFFATVEHVSPGGATLESYLLERHQMLDLLLSQAIDDGNVGQVVEIAAGLSPRGYRFAERYRSQGLLYIEADLPEMAQCKDALLEEHGLASENHRVVHVDLLRRGGPLSLEACLEKELDPSVGTAIIAEGLLSYFDRMTLAGIWSRLGASLSRFPTGLFLTNVELADEAEQFLSVRVFKAALGLFASSPMHLCFDNEREAQTVLNSAGFGQVQLHRPSELLGRASGPVVMRVLQASI